MIHAVYGTRLIYAIQNVANDRHKTSVTFNGIYDLQRATFENGINNLVPSVEAEGIVSVSQSTVEIVTIQIFWAVEPNNAPHSQYYRSLYQI